MLIWILLEPVNITVRAEGRLQPDLLPNLSPNLSA